MILQALAAYYEKLVEQQKLEGDGWGSVKCPFALELSDAGELLSLMPLTVYETNAKGKTVEKPRVFSNMPAPVKKSSGVLSNFLFENAQYIFGIGGEKAARARECFEAAKELHLRVLSDCDSDTARAICNFFSAWQPEKAEECAILQPYSKELQSGANITFFHNGDYACNNPYIRAAWQQEYNRRNSSGAATDICLITGERVSPAVVHPAVKGVRDAQSSGAAIVSFNADAFCSYGKEQGENAPIGPAAAFAYTTAINRLLATAEHKKFWGDSTVVYWAEDAEDA